ncbi:MAG: hypothetical protein JW912_03240 [Sedimentisphaerales bacterium]|nr:hypothetical protein [Sedimentisphaerales bacterium]
MLSKGNSYERSRAEKVLSPEIIKELENLSRGLYEVDCVVFKREENALLFFKMGSAPFPDLLPSLKTVLPYGSGVLYSMDGSNPNDTSNDILKDYKPFEKITDGWYASKNLILTGPRFDIPAKLPNALIDHSLKINDLKLD